MSDKDRDQIRRVIETAYIQGIHLEQRREKMQSGFHLEFRMSVRKGDEIDNVGPEEFLRLVTDRRANDPSFFELPRGDVCSRILRRRSHNVASSFERHHTERLRLSFEPSTMYPLLIPRRSSCRFDH